MLRKQAEPAEPGRQRRPLGGDAAGGAGGIYFAAGFLLKKSGMLNFSGTPILLLM
jgi:hypothetical protein